MGHFYNPFQPHMGRGQPLEPRKLSPGVPGQSVDKPPVGTPYDLGWPLIVDVWQVHSGDPLAVDFYMPPRRLNPSLTAVSVDFPPIQVPENFWAVWSWVPPDPAPTQAKKLSPGIPGQSVDRPPVGAPYDLGYPNLLASWQPPDPAPFMGGPQPLERSRLAPGIPGQSIDAPQPRLLTLPSGVIVGWLPSDPSPQRKETLSPGIPGQSVDLPPSLRLAAVPAVDPAALPWTPRYLVQAAIAAVAQNPFVPAWLASVIASWAPVDPAPTRQGLLNPSITAVRVDSPPIPQPESFLSAYAGWIPADPAPQAKGKLSPGVPGQSVDRPPGVAPKAPASLAAWMPPPPTPQAAGRLSPGIPGQSIDNPPSLRIVAVTAVADVILPTLTRFVVQSAVVASSQVPFVGAWLASVIASWIVADPLPLRRGLLSPSITAVPVDAPPPRVFVPATLPALDPQPQSRGALSPGIPGQSVDRPPPFVRQRDQVAAEVVAPQTRGNISAGVPGQSVDVPPRLRQPPGVIAEPAPRPWTPRYFVQSIAAQVPFLRNWLPPIIAAWIGADPLPASRRTLPPSITAVAVNNPPFGLRTPLGPIYVTWEPAPPLPWRRFYGTQTLLPLPPPSPDGTPAADNEASRRLGRRGALARSAAREASPRGVSREAAARAGDDEAMPRSSAGPAKPRLH